jgi:hypothetical protein
MGPRAAIILASLSSALLIGCAESNANSGSPDLSAQPGTDLAMEFCTATISITANPPPDTSGGFVYAPADLIATATSNASSLEKPVWTVTFGDGTSYTPEVVDAASGLTVRFHAPLPGSYTFRVDFPQAACRGQSAIDVHSRDSRTQAYKLRISPPTASGIPQQDQLLLVYGDTPNGGADLNLVKGDLISSTLMGPGSVAIAGEVRLLGDSGPDAVALAGVNGAFAVPVNLALDYTPLLIPAGTSLAPRLFAKAKGVDLAGISFTVDAGEGVSGTVLDPADLPIAGAKVVLRAGKLPSGAGLSASDGSYTLRAQPGSHLASIGAEGWPELTVPSVSVPGGGTSLDVKYLVSRVTVSARVVSSGGAAVAGARVSLRSVSLPGVATVTVGGVAQSANGRVKQVVVSAADGTLPPLQLPPLGQGSYEILIEPPAGNSDGVTRVERPLAGPDSWTLTLQPKISLSGKVTNLLGSGLENVKVTAFETAGLGAAPSTLSAMDGSWSLVVDAGSPLEMLFEPPGSANLSSTRLPLAAGTTQAEAALAPGLRIGGVVTAPGGARLPAVVIEALCSACGSLVPVARTISDGAGSYALYLPDPGLVYDGGVVDGSP